FDVLGLREPHLAGVGDLCAGPVMCVETIPTSGRLTIQATPCSKSFMGGRQGRRRNEFHAWRAALRSMHVLARHSGPAAEFAHELNEFAHRCLEDDLALL